MARTRRNLAILAAGLGLWSGLGALAIWQPQVLAMLGFDVSGTLDLQASDLQGARARVQLVIEDHVDKLTGIHRRRLRVPYAGYEPAEPGLQFPAA